MPLCVELTDVVREYRAGGQVVRALDGLENVAIPCLLDGQKLRQVWPGAARLLDRVGLHNRIDYRSCELSGGQMQRVAIARALMMNSLLILADEPTGNLDSAIGAAIMGLLHDAAHDDGTRRAVVMVTHILEATASTDRVITMQDGALRSEVVPRRGLPPSGRHSASMRDQPTDIKFRSFTTVRSPRVCSSSVRRGIAGGIRNAGAS